jgi:NAD(P)-dependent dehydrogenase (short-subunit alcohol dehydrogenase family)
MSQATLPDVYFVDPQDVTEVVAFLVSPRARYVTGVTVPVDAGHLAT